MDFGITSGEILTEASAWAVGLGAIVLIAIGYRVVFRVANWIVAKFRR